jgi:hypothetical protein
MPQLLWFVVVGWPGFLCVILIRHGLHINPHAFASASATIPVSSLIGAYLLSIVSTRMAFSTDGVYGYSFWGPRRFVRWQDIATAQTFSVLNLRWLRIRAASHGKVTWLALFPAHRAAFRQEIRRFAPPASPVLNHL